MGKKGKKKGGKKKNEEPDMSWKEALTLYLIRIKRQQMEEVQFELRGVTQQYNRHKERNERLKGEQDIFLQELLKQSKEFEKILAAEEIIEKDSVVQAMMNKWDLIRQQENGISALTEKIAKTEVTFTIEQQELEKWVEYKEVGTLKDDAQIQLLKQELVDMKNSFKEMVGHIERTMDKTKSDIERSTQESLDKQKHLASEKAMGKMDKESRQEVVDNEWLQREVAIHREESDSLKKQVNELEAENLGIMSELFDASVEDLKVSRNFFLTQFQDGENLETDGILEVDLAKLSLQSLANEASSSAVALVGAVPYKMDQAEDEQDSDDESHYDGVNDDEGEEDVFSNFFYLEDEDFEDYLQLGPLELKLLNVQGKKMDLHRPGSNSVPGAMDQLTSDWPFTRSQIVSKLNK